MEIAVSSDDGVNALCHECDEAGCDHSGQSECQAPTWEHARDDGYDDETSDAGGL